MKAANTILVILVLFTGTLEVSAQQYSRNQSKTSMAHVINGGQHPEMIPEAVAIRLYIMTVAKMPPQLQAAQLHQVGLSNQDVIAATGVIERFKSRWDSIRDEYNGRVMANTAGTGIQVAFLAERDALVQATTAELQKALTASGFARVTGYIHAEKSHMKLSAPASGQ